MPYKIKKVKNQNCYEVINSETGKIHSKCTSREKAKAQVRILESLLVGEGFADIVDKLSFKKRAVGKLGPKSRKLLEQVGNEKITDMKLIRTPIESYINKVLGIVSLGNWQSSVQKAGYDKLFHLSIFINNKYVLHKVEILTFEATNPIKSDSETMPVPLGIRTITINELIENTRKYMGDENFSNYNAKNNNCQVFVDSVLTANGLNSSELKKFVLQDSVKIFNENPSWLEGFTNVVTDLGARVNRFLEGEGVKKQPKPNKWIQALKVYNKDNTKFCFPKKNTKDYFRVKEIMEKL